MLTKDPQTHLSLFLKTVPCVAVYLIHSLTACSPLKACRLLFRKLKKCNIPLKSNCIRLSEVFSNITDLQSLVTKNSVLKKSF